MALATLRLDGVSHVHFAKRMREHGAGVRRGGFQFDLMIARHVAGCYQALGNCRSCEREYLPTGCKIPPSAVATEYECRMPVGHLRLLKGGDLTIPRRNLKSGIIALDLIPVGQSKFTHGFVEFIT